MKLALKGLVAATFTPMHAGGGLHLAAIEPMLEHLHAHDISCLYVLGSTGEGISLAEDERRAVAETFVSAARGRFQIIVQVGSDSVMQARRLAAHAEQIGADAVSATCPVYFKPESTETLVATMAEVAAASQLPFYYYHIPSLTGTGEVMLEFLRSAEREIPTLAGIKFTSPAAQHFQACVEYGGGKYDILWGLDEMLLSGLCAGGTAAVGSTYNFAPVLYQRLLAAFDDGRLEEARRLQSLSQLLVRTFLPYGRGAQKAIMSMCGVDCGPARLPIKALDAAAAASLQQELEKIGLFDWGVSVEV